jgi:PAS domain-containing protein
VAERDAQMKEQAASHASAQEALQTRSANRIAQLRRELDEMIVMHRAQFEYLPSSVLRCAGDGAVEQVTGAMSAMLGYRTAQEAQAVNFATSVFESPDDWRSLIDRCRETGAAESLETIWKKKNGARFVVRLHAVPGPSGQIDVAAEDLTNYRELEEKLRRSERMEAVGRLASEVAATCDNLLRDVRQDGQTWLAAISDDSPVRQQGELLLNDVTRAASFLRQLDVYSKTQTDSSEPADLNRVLRNLAPVLKRVAGDDIEFVLPKSTSPLTVDVELERVERILVNVAAYGRERMPFGGRLVFELAKVTVGNDSVASHSDVRPGPHALITVTAVRYAVWSDASRTFPRLSQTTNASESASDRPGVDLGAMQALIRGCGGRLWLAAEPPGDMVLKIHLPRSTPAHAAVPRTAMSPVRRWLHVGR